jgi:hypothetical protein
MGWPPVFNLEISTHNTVNRFLLTRQIGIAFIPFALGFVINATDTPLTGANHPATAGADIP